MYDLPRMIEKMGDGKLERSKHFSITGPDDGVFCAKASLKDRQHNMEVVVVIQEGTMEILEVQGSIIEAPHDPCPSSVEGLKSLVGMRIQPGLFGEMQRRVGGFKGCIHMNELIRESVQLVAAQRNLTDLRRMHEAGHTYEEMLEWAESVRSWTCVAAPDPIPNG